MKEITFNADFRVSGRMLVKENLSPEELVEYICKNVDIKNLRITDTEFEDIHNIFDENNKCIYDKNEV